MKIANPLYDHAFKYLMSNDRLARKVLSVILDKEVLDMDLEEYRKNLKMWQNTFGARSRMKIKGIS